VRTATTDPGRWLSQHRFARVFGVARGWSLPRPQRDRLHRRLAADRSYGSAPMLNWLVEEKGIAPHIPVFDKSKRDDGTFSRGDFDMTRPATSTTAPAESGSERAAPCAGARRSCIVPASLTAMYAHSNRSAAQRNHHARFRVISEHARDVARSLAGTVAFEQSRRERKKIEMRFAHLKRILRLGRLRLRGPRGAPDEFVLAAIAQNLRPLASLVARPPPARALGIA